ncbi:choice-of-anchor J domain-containing protein [Prevotella dentasini]|uniref:choice-of-anchor J domain-containing protein n=1 Tax=Prevotella dentasini TaxID=589537 RepID=UPI000469E67F|nr:choice-of-anchor J domain-containing protein [Prevotella dentasini]
MTRTVGQWYEYNVDLPAGTRYVAFRHYNCTDQFRLNIDDVTVFGTADGISTVATAVPAKKQGIYNLQGVRMSGDFSRLPAGIYIVDGKKVVKK